MIDRDHEVSLTRQAELLGISRGSAYYAPRPVPESDLKLMRRIDELHLEHPFMGARRLRDLLNREGFPVGRRHVSTLMERMGIEALYPRPDASRRHPAHPVHPYLLRGLTIDRANFVWAMEIVFTQMTKTDVLAARVGRDDITNFDLGIRHDNPVDQKLDQLTLLFEGGIEQPPLNAGAELLDGDGQSGHFLVAFGLGRELGLLFRQRLVPLRQVAAAPLILGQGDDGLQVGFC